MKNPSDHKILIVDDSKDLAHLLAEDLIEKKYQVQIALNGEEALKLISEHGLPSVILLDMNMPIMDGWTFSQKFSDLYGRSCPIIIMTAEDDSQIRAMEIGADSYLGKPFDLETLDNTLDAILNGEDIHG
jgi:DNA-binding response OmpR family regulator